MTKALSRVGSAEHCTLSKDEISNIASTSSGDIRAAINNLQFSSISGFVPKSLKHGKAKPVTLGGKDTSMIMFRALGKIFYCKREKRKESDSMSSPTHRDDLIVQPEDILDQCCLSGSAFGLFLHQNFINFFDDNPLEDVAASLEHLSSSDVVGSSITSSDMSTNSRVSLDYYEGVIAARGLTYSNSLRATADLCAKSSGAWRPLHKPAWFQVRRKRQESEIQSHFLFSRMMQADLVLSTLPYLFHLKSHCELNPAQRMFATDIVVLPKWKVYRSENNDRLTEHETGSIETKEVEVKKKLNLDIEPSIQDDDVEIDDFSD
uniref:Uncharacterized protein n=1 Tax=Ciona savignyi TaxID=51511 RepID=H2ZNF0_CIOSA